MIFHEVSKLQVFFHLFEIKPSSHGVKFPGFEAGGPHAPSNIDPWSNIGDEAYVNVSTERSSCFARNIVALRMDILCDSSGANICPDGGVGVYNPGFWGMVRASDHIFDICLLICSSPIL